MLRPLLLVALLVAPAFSGCLVTRLPGLFGEEAPIAGDGGGGGPGAAAPTRVENVTWELNDTWTWMGENGARITDRVVGLRYLDRVILGRPVRFTLYDVETKEEHGRGLLPTWSNHTYEGGALGVIESRAPGEHATYTGTAQGVPLTFIGPRTFNTTLHLTRWGETGVFERAANITNDGQKVVRVPAGEFVAWHVRTNVTTRTGILTLGTVTQERWFSPLAKNDVRFSVDGTQYALVAYHLDNGTRSRSAMPDLVEPPRLWMTGWGWHYAGPNGTSITRDIVRCGPQFDLCRTSQAFVWENNRDFHALRTRTHLDGGLTLTEITLVPVGDYAPYAVDFQGTYESAPFSADLNFTPKGVPYVPVDGGRYEFTVVGRGFDGLPMNHTAIAKVDVTGEENVTTAYGPLRGERVVTDATYFPRGGSGSFTGTQEERTERVWSSLVRNDLVIVQRTQEGTFEFVLDGVRFGEVRKADRDL